MSCGTPAGGVALLSPADGTLFFWVLPFGAEPFHIRIGRGSSVTVIDFESFPLTLRTETGALGTSGSLRSERSNSKV